MNRPPLQQLVNESAAKTGCVRERLSRLKSKLSPTVSISQNLDPKNLTTNKVEQVDMHGRLMEAMGNLDECHKILEEMEQDLFGAAT